MKRPTLWRDLQSAIRTGTDISWSHILQQCSHRSCNSAATEVARLRVLTEKSLNRAQRYTVARIEATQRSMRPGYSVAQQDLILVAHTSIYERISNSRCHFVYVASTDCSHFPAFQQESMKLIYGSTVTEKYGIIKKDVDSGHVSIREWRREIVAETKKKKRKGGNIDGGGEEKHLNLPALLGDSKISNPGSAQHHTNFSTLHARRLINSATMRSAS